MNAPLPTTEQVTAALGGVQDPEIHKPITELGMVKSVSVRPDGVVEVGVYLTVSGCPMRETLTREVTAAVGKVPGVSGVKVWDCGVGCYDQKQFIDAGGADVEGQYVDTLFLPFYSKADQKANAMLANYVKYTGQNNLAGFDRAVREAGREERGKRPAVQRPQDRLAREGRIPCVRLTPRLIRFNLKAVCKSLDGSSRTRRDSEKQEREDAQLTFAEMF